MGTDETRDAALMTSVTIAAKDGAWKDALTASEQEVRRAIEHGFTAGELKTQVADMTGALHAAAEQQDTRTNQSLANCDPRRRRPRQVRDHAQVHGRRVRCSRQDAHAGGSERRLPRAVDRKRAAGPRQRQAGHSDAAARRRPSTRAAPSPSPPPRTARPRPSPTTASASPAPSPRTSASPTSESAPSASPTTSASTSRRPTSKPARCASSCASATASSTCRRTSPAWRR